MKEPDWNALLRPQEWASTLEELLHAAEDSIKSGKPDRQEVSKLLSTFVKKSPFNANPLDDIANDAIIDINIAEIDIALLSIKKRLDELQKQIDFIEVVTKQAGDDAVKLRFDNLNKVLATAKTGLKALQDANNVLNNPSKTLTDKIDALVKAIDALGK